MAFTKMLYLIPLMAWSCEYKPPAPPPLKANSEAKSEDHSTEGKEGKEKKDEHAEAAKADSEGKTLSGPMTCDKTTPPIVIFNKEKDTFEFCDKGNWVKLAQNEAERRVSPEHGAAPKKETHLPKTTKLEKETEKGARRSIKLEPKRRDSDTFHCRTSAKNKQSYICSRFEPGVPETSGS